MKIVVNTLAVLVIVFSFAQAQNDEAQRKHYNLKKLLAMEGYDPVSYFDKKPLEGSSDYEFAYKGVTYRFSTAANMNKFKAIPGNYEPAYGGWCAYAMGENGEKVKVDPETYKILDGKLYLFYNFWGNNTLNAWNKKEGELRARGDLNWKKIIQ